MKKIDIHCHLLPRIDDGPRMLSHSLKMLEIASKEGITDVIATPHFHYRRGNATPNEVHLAAERLRESATRRGIPVRIHLGNELYYTQELLQAVKNGDALTMAGSNYVLLEFSSESEQRQIQNAVYEFQNEGYYPILAHPERYLAFLKDPEFVNDVTEMGAYLQCNAGSFMGNAGWRTKWWSRKLLKSGKIHFVASDAHDLEKRRPEFRKWETWTEKVLGENELRNYLSIHPDMILKNKVI